MYLTNIDVTNNPIEVTSINSAFREFIQGSTTATLQVTLLSSEDYRNLQAMLGKNVELLEIRNDRLRVNTETGEINYSGYTLRDTEGEIKNTGQIKERMLEFSKPQPIKTRQITSAIKELDLNE